MSIAESIAGLGPQERLESFSDSSRRGYKMVNAYMAARAAAMKADQRMQGFKLRLESRVDGAAMTRLKDIFGCEVEVVDRNASSATFSGAFHVALGQFMREVMTHRGEECLEVDTPVVSDALRMRRDGHRCYSQRSSFARKLLNDQLMALDKLLESRTSETKAWRVDAASVSRALRGLEVDSRVCLDARKCAVQVDTINLDLSVVDVSSRQLLDMIDQHGAVRGRVFFYFEVDMLVEDTGPLTVGGRWKVDRARDKLFVYLDGLACEPLIYTFSTVLTYVLRASAENRKSRGVIEVFDTRAGVRFVQLSKVFSNAEYDSVTAVRWSRSSGCAMLVLDQEWVPPLSGGARRRVRTPVVRDLFEKVVDTLHALPDKSLSIASARRAVSNATNEVVGVGPSFRRAAVVETHVPELVALGALKHVLAEKASAAAESVAIARAARASWVSKVIGSVVEAAVDFSSALVTVVVGEGTESVLVDYAVNVEDLPEHVIMRDVVVGGGKRDVFEGVVMTADLPGGRAGGYGSSSDSLASVSSVSGDVSVETEEEFHLRPRGVAALGEDRGRLVERFVDDFEAVALPLERGSKRVYATVDPPACVTLQPGVGAASKITDNFAEAFGDLGDIDYTQRAATVSAVERSYAVNAVATKINLGKDTIVRPREVWEPGVRSHGEGARVSTQAEVMLAFSTRVANAPMMAEPADSEKLFSDVFRTFSEACFREDWREVVSTRMRGGLWLPRAEQVKHYVSRMDVDKVQAALREDFQRGSIDMERWKALVKPEVKTKAANSTAETYKALQTILCQPSKSTNAYFSSVTTEFVDVLEEICLPEVRVNVRESNEGFERWYNSLNVRRKSAGAALQRIECDITQCDKSQFFRNLLYFLYFLRQLGLFPHWEELWSVIVGKKTLSSELTGVLMVVFAELMSGAWLTLLLNCIVTSSACVAGLKVRKGEVVCVGVKGDDNVFELVGSHDVGEAAAFVRDAFNFESKMLEVPHGVALSFCSMFIVEVEGYGFFVRDPFKAIASLGKESPVGVDRLHEEWVSFADSCQHYDKLEVMEGLNEAVRQRYVLPCSMREAIDGVTTAVLSFEEFEKCRRARKKVVFS